MSKIATASAVERWKTSGRKEVTLPSGWRVRGVMPSVESLVVRGLLPTDLQTVALKYATSGVQITDLASEAFRDFTKFAREMAAAFVREVWDDEAQAWEPVSMSASDLSEIDPGDVDALEQIVLRQKTVDQITSGDTEGAGPVADKAGFPGESAGPDPGQDGGEVRESPVSDAPDRRPRGGPRPRRSRGPASGD